MKNVSDLPVDFEAEIYILTHEEGGRKSPPFNFIRWDLGYADFADENALYMIHPEFLDEHGVSIGPGIPLVGTFQARMRIVIDEMRLFHRERMHVGLKFTCHEGRHIVARGTITKLVGLVQNE